MRWHAPVSLLLAVLAQGAAAEIYKCEVDGKPVFADRPCGDGGEQIEVRYREADPDGVAALDAQRRFVESERAEDAEQRYRRAVREQIRRVANLEGERDAALARLAAAKAATPDTLDGHHARMRLSDQALDLQRVYHGRIRAEREVLRRLEAAR